jgi:hypothetical protein
MWGPSIVGYGSYTYRYKSGHSGDAPLAGFAVRGRELVVYLSLYDPGQAELLARLEALIAGSVSEVERRYG